MLDKNPKTRISAQDCLEHPWFKKQVFETPIEVKQQNLDAELKEVWEEIGALRENPLGDLRGHLVWTNPSHPILDFHGMSGSQNAEHHSGQAGVDPRWLEVLLGCLRGLTGSF